MKPKPKICQACGAEYMPFNSLQKTCPKYECAKAVGRQIMRKKELAPIRAEARKQKKENRTRSEQNKLMQDAFNRMIKARDRLWYLRQGKQPECISCGTTNPNIQYAAGHYKTRGAFPELAIDEENCHLQCNKYCNRELSGNINGTKTTHGYEKGLKKRYGSTRAQEIIDRLNGPTEPLKLTIEEMAEKTKEFNRQAREYEREIKNLWQQ